VATRSKALRSSLRPISSRRLRRSKHRKLPHNPSARRHRRRPKAGSRVNRAKQVPEPKISLN